MVTWINGKSELASSPQPTRNILNSWKEISTYVGRGIRTLQRYEEQLGFPVHRASAKHRSSVIAFADEIDHWLRNRPEKSVVPRNSSDSGDPETDLMRAQEALQKALAAYRLSLRRYNEAKHRSTLNGAASGGTAPVAKWHWPAGMQFIRTELQVATTMAEIAKSAVDRDRRERTRRNARAAYERAARHVGDVFLDSENSRELSELFAVLRAQLVTLGEAVAGVSLDSAKNRI